MHTDTKLATLSLAPESDMGVVNVPVHRASTILFKTLEDFEKADRGEWPLPSYGRYGTPSTLAFEEAIAALEGADYAIAHASGMAAIASSLTAFARTGDHVLMVDTAYGPNRRFCEGELKKYGVQVTYYDPTIGADIAALMQPNTRVVYLESPGSLTFEVQDIEAIADVAHNAGAIVISDNTWASPLHFRPFEHGIDISMHSATKYISGHSDLVMGVLSCKETHYKQLLKTCRNLGASPSADDCYLALRGLRTMGIRMQHQLHNALKVAVWLKARPEVEAVFYPPLEGDAGHALWKKYYTGGASLFSIALKPCSHAALSSFINGLRYFGLGYSWGGFESLLITFDPARVRTASTWAYKGPCLRFHIGLEHVDDIIADLSAGFDRLNRT